MDEKPRPPGRPRKEINWAEFDKLCFIQATLREIALWYACSEDTIERRVNEEFGISFAEYHAQKSSGGKMSLRRKLYEMADRGNMTALIWLSKQHLGMSEKVDTKTEISTKDDGPLTFRVRFDDEEPSAPSGSDPAPQDPTPKTDL